MAILFFLGLLFIFAAALASSTRAENDDEWVVVENYGEIVLTNGKHSTSHYLMGRKAGRDYREMIQQEQDELLADLYF
jgi:regulator of protease activity HflC (stomatin/prohibitin superfamily)